jgi:hypothetical protein
VETRRKPNEEQLAHVLESTLIVEPAFERLIFLFVAIIYSDMVRAFSFEVLFLNIFSKNGMSPSVAKAIFCQIVIIKYQNYYFRHQDSIENQCWLQ